MAKIFLDHRKARAAESRDIKRIHAVVQALGYEGCRTGRRQRALRVSRPLRSRSSERHSEP